MSNAFRVNTYQNNWQRNPDVIPTADGGFMIFYESYLNDYGDGPSATVIVSQRFDAGGGRVGGETLLQGADGTSSTDVRAALLSDGGHVITWVYDDYDDVLTTRERVFVRAYDADGTPRTGAIRVDTVPANDAVAPEVFATANGGFKVVFGVDRSQALFDQIYSQQFAANGARIGGNTLVNVNEGDFDQIYARSATLRNGSTITIWNSEGSFPTEGDLDSNEVRGTLTNAAGAVTRADFTLTINYGTVGSAFGNTGSGYDVAALQSGGFVVTNKNFDFQLGLDTEDTSYYTMMRFFDAAGRRTGAPVVVYASDDLPNSTRTVQLATGEILVVWDQDDDTPNFIGDTIYGRLFSSTGQALTGRFDIGATVPSYFDQDDPEVAALPGGGFVVTFMSEYVDDDDDGVAARIFGRGTGGDDRQIVDVTGVLYGLAGNDLLIGNRADNLLDGGAGNDRLVGGAGDDILRGGDGADRLEGGDGRDLLGGGNGGDRLFGNRGDDRLYGAGGNDTLLGGAGRDLLSGSYGSDGLYGEDGGDTLSGGAASDTLGGGAGNDTVLGDAGDDLLFGGFGADLLGGGAGNDRIVGGPGPDRLYGGTGADAFVYNAVGDSAAGAGDRLYGFERQDVIDLRGIDANAARAGDEAFDFVGAAGYGAAGTLRFAVDGGNGYLLGDVNGDGQHDLIIALIGVTRLSADDLLL